MPLLLTKPSALILVGIWLYLTLFCEYASDCIVQLYSHIYSIANHLLHSQCQPSLSPSLLAPVLTRLERSTAWSVLLQRMGYLISQSSSGWTHWTVQFSLRWSLQLATWTHWHLIHWQPTMPGRTHVKWCYQGLWPNHKPSLSLCMVCAVYENDMVWLCLHFPLRCHCSGDSQ